jgi:VanZ family protein
MASNSASRAPHGKVSLWWHWGPVLLWAAWIFYLSSQSHPPVPSWLLPEGSDKVLHGWEYGLLGLLCFRAFRRAAGPWAAERALVLAILSATLYGLSDELHQAFVPDRTADLFDLLADGIGAAAGAWGLCWYEGRARPDRESVPRGNTGSPAEIQVP